MVERCSATCRARLVTLRSGQAYASLPEASLRSGIRHARPRDNVWARVLHCDRAAMHRCARVGKTRERARPGRGAAGGRAGRPTGVGRPDYRNFLRSLLRHLNVALRATMIGGYCPDIMVAMNPNGVISRSCVSLIKRTGDAYRSLARPAVPCRLYLPLGKSALNNCPAGTSASQLCFSLILKWRPRRCAWNDKTKESHMIKKQHVFAGCAAIVLSIATAHAGPCNTGGKSAQDAGAGPTPGHTGQTVGSSGFANAENPPTSTMNRATGDAAASSQDAQKQMQGQPTAAQQSQGAEPSAKMTDQDC